MGQHIYGAAELWGSAVLLWGHLAMGQRSYGAVWCRYGAAQLWGSVVSLWGHLATMQPRYGAVQLWGSVVSLWGSTVLLWSHSAMGSAVMGQCGLAMGQRSYGAV